MVLDISTNLSVHRILCMTKASGFSARSSTAMLQLVDPSLAATPSTLAFLVKSIDLGAHDTILKCNVPADFNLCTILSQSGCEPRCLRLQSAPKLVKGLLYSGARPYEESICNLGQDHYPPSHTKPTQVVLSESTHTSAWSNCSQ